MALLVCEMRILARVPGPFFMTIKLQSQRRHCLSSQSKRRPDNGLETVQPREACTKPMRGIHELYSAARRVLGDRSGGSGGR